MDAALRSLSGQSPAVPLQSPAVPEQGQWPVRPAAAGAVGCRCELRAASGLFCSAYCCDAALGCKLSPLGNFLAERKSCKADVRPGKMHVKDQDDDGV